MPSFLEDLLGIKTVRAAGSSPVPQRSVLEFQGGFSITDDPVNKRTVCTFDPGALLSVAVDLDDLGVSFIEGVADFGRADVVRLYGALTLTISGLTAFGITQRRKTLVNVGSAALTIFHDIGDVPAGSRFLLPGGLPVVLPANGSVDILNLASDPNWRLIQ